MKKTHPNIIKSPLFSGLSESEISLALDFFAAHETEYKRGEHINNVGDKLDFFGLVLDGAVQVYTVDIDGNEMIMANVEPGETFGESLNFLGREADIYICASEDTKILMMSSKKISFGQKSEGYFGLEYYRLPTLLSLSMVSPKVLIQLACFLLITETGLFTILYLSQCSPKMYFSQINTKSVHH
jgi:CRP-like cAMP-binding protein